MICAVYKNFIHSYQKQGRRGELNIILKLSYVKKKPFQLDLGWSNDLEARACPIRISMIFNVALRSKELNGYAHKSYIPYAPKID